MAALVAKPVAAISSAIPTHIDDLFEPFSPIQLDFAEPMQVEPTEPVEAAEAAEAPKPKRPRAHRVTLLLDGRDSASVTADYALTDAERRAAKWAPWVFSFLPNARPQPSKHLIAFFHAHGMPISAVSLRHMILSWNKVYATENPDCHCLEAACTRTNKPRKPSLAAAAQAVVEGDAAEATAETHGVDGPQVHIVHAKGHRFFISDDDYRRIFGAKTPEQIAQLTQTYDSAVIEGLKMMHASAALSGATESAESAESTESDNDSVTATVSKPQKRSLAELLADIPETYGVEATPVQDAVEAVVKAVVEPVVKRPKIAKAKKVITPAPVAAPVETHEAPVQALQVLEEQRQAYEDLARDVAREAEQRADDRVRAMHTLLLQQQAQAVAAAEAQLQAAKSLQIALAAFAQ